MITYTWAVNSMMVMPKLDDKDDVVIAAVYSVLGNEGEYSASLSENIQKFVYEGGSFTPYNQLTEEQVIGWIKSSLGEKGILSIESSIAAQIENQKNPPLTPEILPLPWN